MPSTNFILTSLIKYINPYSYIYSLQHCCSEYCDYFIKVIDCSISISQSECDLEGWA